MTTELFDFIEYRKIRVSRDKFIYVALDIYSDETEKDLVRKEAKEGRMGKNSKFVRTNKVMKSVHKFLQSVGIHGGKIYYGETAKELAKFAYTDSTYYLSELTVKRLLKSEYYLAVRQGECFFYDSTMERLDNKFEILLKTLIEGMLCPY